MESTFQAPRPKKFKKKIEESQQGIESIPTFDWNKIEKKREHR